MKSVLIALALTVTMSMASAQQTQIVMEEMMVPSADSGIEIYVRNKRPAGMTAFRPDRTVLFVHSSTVPSSTTFDMPLGGMSWMDYIAQRGYDVYLLDLRGYGKSSRPKEMSEPAANNPPIVRGETAVKDISSVVDFILKRRNIARLHLLAWSWGTSLMAAYTTQNPSKVERLVLYAPTWMRTTPALTQGAAATGPVPAYRLVTRDQARARWLNGAPEDKKATVIPAGWFDQWADATWATDVEGSKMNPPVLRAPNGVVQDGAEYWTAGKPYYDPAKITVPTLLIGAEWDSDNPPYQRQAIFPLLVNSPGKRYVELAEGGHYIFMEKNRLKLFEVVQAFLDEQGKVD